MKFKKNIYQPGILIANTFEEYGEGIYSGDLIIYDNSIHLVLGKGTIDRPIKVYGVYDYIPKNIKDGRGLYKPPKDWVVKLLSDKKSTKYNSRLFRIYTEYMNGELSIDLDEGNKIEIRKN